MRLVSWPLFVSTFLIAVLAGCRTERTTFFGSRPFFGKPALTTADRSRPSAVPKASHSEDPAVQSAASTSDEATSSLPDDVVENETPKSSPAEPFVPDPIHPMSPAARIEPGPLPKGYQARVDEFERIGAKLAESIPASKRTFQFDTVYNPKRPDTIHTEAGHILVTSALLECVETRHQLAAAVALEMAELLREDAQAQSTSGTSALRSNETAGTSSSKPTISEDAIQSTASKLLVQAGFPEMDLSSVSRDLKGMLADASQTAAKLPSADQAHRPKEPKEPAWLGPQTPLAN